mmetsp:Transcript_47660/g.132625  ORF Transcript_47660/g.132625 Transcript_47660/m.132625 type:complete len:256 (-) Transcript_47660:1440-2207(-)
MPTSLPVSDCQRGPVPRCEMLNLSHGSLCSSSCTTASTSSSFCLRNASLKSCGGSINRCTGDTGTVMAVPPPAWAGPGAIKGFFFFPERLGASRAPAAEPGAARPTGTPPALVGTAATTSPASLASSASHSAPKMSRNNSRTSNSSAAGEGDAAETAGPADDAVVVLSSTEALCFTMPLRRCFDRLCIDITCNSRDVIISTFQLSSVGSMNSSSQPLWSPPGGPADESSQARRRESTASGFVCWATPLGLRKAET